MITFKFRGSSCRKKLTQKKESVKVDPKKEGVTATNTTKHTKHTKAMTEVVERGEATDVFARRVAKLARFQTAVQHTLKEDDQGASSTALGDDRSHSGTAAFLDKDERGACDALEEDLKKVCHKHCFQSTPFPQHTYTRASR